MNSFAPTTKSNPRPTRSEQNPVYREIVRELEASAIAPSLIAQLEIVPALEWDDITNEVASTPLDDALGTRYVRFPHNYYPDDWGVIFRNEDGSEWQVKRGFGLPQTNEKSGRYLAPKGIGNAIYTPPVPEPILGKICSRHGIQLDRARTEIEECGGFWAWVLSRQDLPVCVTEGAKKSLAALSQGHIAIALYGCRCGHSKALRPFLANRTVIAAFDADSKESARKAVAKGLYTLAGSVTKQGGSLSVPCWDASAGKGIDDLISENGPAAFDEAIAAAGTFDLWAARRAVAHPLGSYKPELWVNVADLSKAIAPDSLPATGTVIIRSKATGVGKTKLLAKCLESSDAAIAPGHRISLQRGLARRLGLSYVPDSDRHRGYVIDESGQETRRVSLCWDSILTLPKQLFPDGSYEFVLDELDQGLRHLISGGTCGKDGRRPGLLQRAIEFLQGAKRILAASATLTDKEIDFLVSIREETPWILQNDYVANAYPVRLYIGQQGVKGSCTRARSIVLNELKSFIKGGQRAIVPCDQISTTKMLASLGEIWGLHPDQVFNFNKETSTEDEQRAFAKDPDKFLADRDVRLFLFSPSITGGTSLESDYFDKCFGFFEGQTVSPDDALQMLGRNRTPIERVIYASHYGRSDGTNDARRQKDYQAAEERKAQMFQAATRRDANIRPSDDPISTYHAATKAKHNAAMANFASSLQARLEASGHPVERIEAPQAENGDMKQAWSAARIAVADADRRAILYAQPLSPEEAEELRGKRTLKHDEALRLNRHDLCNFYRLDPPSLTEEDIKADKRGWGRKAISRLEGLLYEGLTREKDSIWMKALEQWNQPIATHDLPGAELHSKAAIALGVPELIQNCIENPGWSAKTDWVQAYAQRVRACANDIKFAIGFKVNEKMTDCAIVGMTLRHFGLSTTGERKTIEGQRQRVYSLDPDSLAWAKGALERRSERLKEKGFQPRPYLLTTHFLEGVACPNPPPNPLEVEGYFEWLQSALEIGVAVAQKTWSYICEMTDLQTQQAIRALLPESVRTAIAPQP